MASTSSSNGAEGANIWLACSEGDLAQVEHLLSSDESLTAISKDQNTYTPLHAAASYSHIDLLRFLLKHPRTKKGDVDVRDADGDTPLFVAEDIETAKVLIEEFGADPKITNNEGTTAAWAMWDSGWNEVSDWLRSLTGEAAFAGSDEEDNEAEEGGIEVIDDEAAEFIDDETHSGKTTKEYISLLEEFSSCEISDALVKLKIPSGGHIPNLSLISPSASPSSSDVKLIGQVFPVQMVPTSHPTAPKPSDHYVDVAPKDSVMLISSPPSSANAVWGGLMSARAKARQVKGVVIDGNCRDLKEHWEMGMTIFSKGHSTLGQTPFTRVATIGQPITFPYSLSTLHSHSQATPSSSSSSSANEIDPPLPSLTVNPTDLLIADLDGVVVIPRNLVEEVVIVAKKGKQVDEKCMEDLKAGKGVKETFAKWRGK